jgi:hypothetical protein
MAVISIKQRVNMNLNLLPFIEGFFKEYLGNYNTNFRYIDDIKTSRMEDFDLIQVKVMMLNDKYDDTEIPYKNSKYRYELFYVPFSVLHSIYDLLKWLKEDLYVRDLYFCT